MPRDPREPDAPIVHETVLTRIDIPFLQLTWFFVKASLAAALALVLTSFVWVLVAAGALGLGATGALALTAAKDRLEPAPLVERVSPPTPASAAAPAPVPAPAPDALVEAEPSQPATTDANDGSDEARPVDPEAAHREATRALQIQELERMRRGRHRYDQVPTQ